MAVWVKLGPAIPLLAKRALKVEIADSSRPPPMKIRDRAQIKDFTLKDIESRRLPPRGYSTIHKGAWRAEKNRTKSLELLFSLVLATISTLTYMAGAVKPFIALLQHPYQGFG